MTSKREHEDNVRVNAEGFESDPKKQKRNGHLSPSSSPPPPASEGFLLPGFNYGDEDDEDNYRRPPVNDYRGDGGGAVKLRSGGIVHILMLLIASLWEVLPGRGKKSHAYTHSLEAGHHVYINLRTEKVYCLPDGYEISDPSLDDIRHVLNPRFTEEQVEQIDKNKQWSRALDGSDYLPGMVGLNNIKETDFVNVTIQSLMRVTPLRNFFLIPKNYQHCKSPLVHRFGELTRKIWHARNFKGQVSPHEFLQAVMKASKKRFRIGAQSDPVEFMSWLLNTLHADLRTSKKDSSIIYECFQGELEVVKEIPKKVLRRKKTETYKMPFLMLGLDLPPPPLFKDVMEKNIIPQVPLFNILKKFDGETVIEVVRPRIARMRYRVTRLPQYLILHMRRFTKNNFFVEKNPTLVNFPVKNLELKDYIPLPTPKENERLHSKYDLIANIVHDGKPGEGSYRAFVQRKSEELWYEMQDLHVSETLPQMVALSETYMQIYEQQQ
ncbi:U4/U6.U5 tri-snRNP-associated protein 2-like [Prunus yedoensis var. nudiflora]|uniref:U4/U6.U5 tri-snRNP-associated protein 2-like n=1 Tax=Prunus yedoensis var. nudiflora TaxID=2094558 RepID=A0A314Z6S6_PRUYE|nr:U4/U6.U5 tri-snRNP-associated protein 2-like [Prunus yedoensis var. nudiflora]